MEISSSPPPTTTTPTAAVVAVKTLDHDARIQPNTVPKHLPPPFLNGVLKRHKPRYLHNPTPVVITYRECLKNHAATIGGHAVDGCGEFMPSSTSTPTDPTSLKCAACGCHRNFHRRDPVESFPNNPPAQHVIEYQPHHRHHPPPPPPQPILLAGARGNSSSPPDSPSPPPISSSYYPSAPHMLLALSTGLSAPPPENNPSIPITPGSTAVIGSHPNGKKRFRTKFTQDQKEKMQELAERVGWKMQKRDEDLIIGFCNEIGVEKGVFKVWMHNNKTNLGSKKDSGNQNDNGSYGGGIDFLSNRDNDNHHHHHQQQQPHNDSISSGGNVIGTNGSSSSS